VLLWCEDHRRGARVNASAVAVAANGEDRDWLSSRTDLVIAERVDQVVVMLVLLLILLLLRPHLINEVLIDRDSQLESIEAVDLFFSSPLGDWLND
jgi:hypothetical protein